MKKRFKKNDKKSEEPQNPLHREYGLPSNVRYIMRNMFRYGPIFKLLIPIGIVCAPMMNYLWTFISKFIIDMITGEKDWKNLLGIMALITALQIIFTMLNTWYYSKRWYFRTSSCSLSACVKTYRLQENPSLFRFCPMFARFPGDRTIQSFPFAAIIAP